MGVRSATGCDRNRIPVERLLVRGRHGKQPTTDGNTETKSHGRRRECRIDWGRYRSFVSVNLTMAAGLTIYGQ
jgi:hypothetical protein